MRHWRGVRLLVPVNGAEESKAHIIIFLFSTDESRVSEDQVE